MSLDSDLKAAGLPVQGTAIAGQTVLFTRTLTPQEEATYESIVNPIIYRQAQARAEATAIPNWATWTHAQWSAYFNSNLANGNVTAIANLADAKLMLAKQNAVIDALAKMVIALRNHTRIIE